MIEFKSAASVELVWNFHDEEGNWQNKRERNLMLVRLRDISSFVGEAEYMRVQPWLRGLGSAASCGVWLVLITYGPGTEEQLRAAGLWGLDLMTFRERAKDLSTYAKADLLPVGWNRELFTELQSVTGYMFEPDPKFDKRQEALDLVEGGMTRPEEFESIYRAVGKNFKYTGSKPAPLEKWIDKLTWSTPGGMALSGLKGVGFEIEGEQLRLRKTKNTLVNLIDKRECVKKVEADGFTWLSNVEVKSETAKLRNIYNFCVWAFMMSFWVIDALIEINFRGITSLGENFDEMRARMVEMLDLTARYISFPLDWRGFDKQVSTWQHEEAWDAIADATSSHDVVEKIKAGLRDSHIMINEKGEVFKVRQKNGLLSGIPETSMVGARVNTITCEVVSLMMFSMTGVRPVNYKIRGDDSAIWFTSYAQAALFFVLFSAVADASPEKCRVGQEMEFLRLRYSAKGVVGVLNRSLAGLLQRKPIAEQTPWRRGYRAAVLLEQLPTVERRGGSRVRRFVEHVVSRMMRADGIPISFVGALKQHGGLGMGMPNGAVFERQGEELRVKAKAGSWAVELVRSQVKGVSELEAAMIAENRLEDQISASDDHNLKRFRQDEEVVLVAEVPETVGITLVASLDEARVLAKNSGFGQMPSITARVVEAKEIARVRKVSFWGLLAYTVRAQVQKIERRFHMSRGDAIDWLAGKLGVNNRQCHPELSHLCDILTAASFSLLPRNRHYRLVIARIDWLAAFRVQTSYSHLFSW